MHGLNAGDERQRAVKVLETRHRSGDSFDRPVGLFDDVVEEFAFPHQDVAPGVGDHAVDCGRIGAALVDGDRLWQIMLTNHVFEKTPRCGQVWTGLDHPVHIFPRANSAQR